MLGIGEYVWRLVPANPILLRVVQTSGKHKRDLIVRCVYLGLLVFLSIFFLFSNKLGTNLGELSNISIALFQSMSMLQLALVALLAPVFTAGAITQEKDSQTYDILLSTPLTNGQIVLGSLLSRLFFVIALLVSGIPIFSITQIFGGVAIGKIVLAFLIAAATAFVTASLAMAIATFKVGTRRTIFSFYLFIVIYLVGLFLLDKVEYFKIVTGVDPITGKPIIPGASWFTGLHPFLALQVVFNSPSYRAPALGVLPPELQAWPFGWYLSSPHTFYVSFMFFVSLVLVLPSIVLLRRVAQSTISLKGWILQKVHLSTGNRTRKPRVVWQNPIAWREAKTKASAARATVLRYGFIAAGVLGALALVVSYAQTEPAQYYINNWSFDAASGELTVYGQDGADTFRLHPNAEIMLEGQVVSLASLRGKLKVDILTDPADPTTITSLKASSMPRRLSEDNARRFLLGAVIVEFAVILLIITNAAASAVTREKEDGSLDLLLTTPITSRYYVWGKLRGLVSYVLPLVAVPVVSVAFFIFYDAIRRTASRDPAFDWIVYPEALLILPGLLIIVAAFAGIVGMHMSLRCRTSVRAVMSSVGIVVGICFAMGWCGYGILAYTFRDTEFNLVVGSFSPFTVLTILIDPQTFGGSLFQSGGNETAGRTIVLVVSWIATGAYAAVVWAMYKSMVKNFDMTIRRQSR